MQTKGYGKKKGKVDMCIAITELINRGRIEGMKSGIEQGIKALIETSIEFGSTQAETLDRIIQKMQISYDAANAYVKKYWNP